MKITYAPHIHWNNQLRICEEIATKAHSNQFRKDGITPFITHPRAIVKLVNTDRLKCVAWLHDVLEDTELSAKDLIKDGVDQSVVRMVFALSRFKGETYWEYIKRLEGEEILFKIADISHNISTLHDIPAKDRVSMLKRYCKALQILAGVYQEELRFGN